MDCPASAGPLDFPGSNPTMAPCTSSPTTSTSPVYSSSSRPTASTGFVTAHLRMALRYAGLMEFDARETRTRISSCNRAAVALSDRPFFGEVVEKPVRVGAVVLDGPGNPLGTVRCKMNDRHRSRSRTSKQPKEVSHGDERHRALPSRSIDRNTRGEAGGCDQESQTWGTSDRVRRRLPTRSLSCFSKRESIRL